MWQRPTIIPRPTKNRGSDKMGYQPVNPCKKQKTFLSLPEVWRDFLIWWHWWWNKE